ncbi:MAG: DUF4357 domain-containing protein [Dehalococcoidales bacterium]|nr:DUF4357 domain-containing protein [Dehalococcoidales bacterium]
MAISNREIKPGMVLTGKHHKVEYTCEVVENDGKLVYRVMGEDYKSISAAGSSVTGHPCNGWVFWSEETGKTGSVSQPVKTEITETDSKAGEDVQTDKKSVCRRNPNQKGVPQGQVRWHCYACRKSFLLPSTQVPDGCPGHPIS